MGGQTVCQEMRMMIAAAHKTKEIQKNKCEKTNMKTKQKTITTFLNKTALK